MTRVLRITANLAAGDPMDLQPFYQYLFGLEVVMDLGFITTLEGAARQPVQLSLASEGGGGTPVPHLSIEVESLDPVIARARLRSLPVEYGPVVEPWGVRRLMLRDPGGRLLNVLEHVTLPKAPPSRSEES